MLLVHIIYYTYNATLVKSVYSYVVSGGKEDATADGHSYHDYTIYDCFFTNNMYYFPTYIRS